MPHCNWYEIDSFNSAYDAASFEAYLGKQVSRGHASLVDDADVFDLQVQAYMCSNSGEIWHLRKPDGNSQGYWRQAL